MAFCARKMKNDLCAQLDYGHELWQYLKGGIQCTLNLLPGRMTPDLGLIKAATVTKVKVK